MSGERLVFPRPRLKTMTKFRIPKTKTTKPTSPEELFRTLKRSPKVPHLWAHQADLLRAYAKNADKPNIALELPTGAGKSLVGLLVAEFRRQARDERVAYLCPTRQLARQVHAQAGEYGIPTVVLTGKQKEYDPADFAAYNTAAKIALTTYSAVFNTNPRIDKAECLLLDDAHAAENYIANLWSVQVERDSHRSTYDSLVDLFHDVLPESLVFHMAEDDEPADEGGVGIVHPPTVWQRSQRVREILSAASGDITYPWSMIEEHLGACHIYMSRPRILIRPLCPPSEAHAPFASPNQRIFMSATLGSGGDLERATGVREIHRLPLPKGWERRGTGRRLILLPNLSLRTKEAEQLAADLAKRDGRLLVLTTDGGHLKRIESGWLKGSGKTILHADDIEADLDVFTQDDNAALVLTNRYDGIDLPDDACRRMVIDDHPDATNLQERFLTQRLGAGAFLRERIRTRVTQAMGRCTRNDSDHATILILGERLAKFLTERDVRCSLHPELQAELQFGIDNSKEQTAAGFLELIDQFQSDEWDEAEQHLVEAREELSCVEDPVAGPLRAIVKHELDYVYASWNDDWTHAAGAARKVTDGLEGGSELKPYQALWYYIASNATVRAESQRSAPTGLPDDLLRRAVACAPGLSFFLKPLKLATGIVRDDEAHAATMALNAARRLARLGHIGTKFEKHMNTVKSDLDSTKAATFERGLDALGELLGFEVIAGIGKEEAAPDSVWHLDRDYFLGWEAKSDEKPDGSIAVSRVRQTKGHFDWIKDRFKLGTVSAVSVAMASPKAALDAGAKKFAESVAYISLDGVRDLAKDVARALTNVRRDAGGASETLMAEAVLKEFKAAKLLPKQLLGRVVPLTSLPLA